MTWPREPEMRTFGLGERVCHFSSNSLTTEGRSLGMALQFLRRKKVFICQKNLEFCGLVEKERGLSICEAEVRGFIYINTYVSVPSALLLIFRFVTHLYLTAVES